MSDHVVDVTLAAAEARRVAREAATSAHLTRTRSRLLRAQNAGLRAKLTASPGRTSTRDAYVTMLGEMFASTDLMKRLAGPLAPDGGAAAHAARSAHRRILERYAALGPSLPN